MRIYRGALSPYWMCLTAVLLGGLLAGCSGIAWETSYESAMRTAAMERKRVLLVFMSATNIDCMEMERTVFSNESIQDLMGRYAAVRLDPLLHRDMARELNVQTLPAFMVVRPDGQLVGGAQGKMDIDKFQVFLIRHLFN